MKSFADLKHLSSRKNFRRILMFLRFIPVTRCFQDMYLMTLVNLGVVLQGDENAEVTRNGSEKWGNPFSN